MKDILKGNYQISNDLDIKEDINKMEENLEKIFEEKAAENLGGSIAFVVKDKFVWEEN